MRFPANCLIVSAVASLRPGNRFRAERNRTGRIHFFWTDSGGSSWEFYKKGASGKNYLQNSLYFGEIRRTFSANHVR